MGDNVSRALQLPALRLARVPLPGTALCHVRTDSQTLCRACSSSALILLPDTQVVSSQPYLGDGRGAAALRLLNVLHSSIHPTLGPLWNAAIPPLVEHLEGTARIWGTAEPAQSNEGRASTRASKDCVWPPRPHRATVT